MILTGKAAKFAEEFEELDKELLSRDNIKITPLDEGDQKDLFMITMMFERDKVFKFFMRGCLGTFVEKSLAGQEAMSEMLHKMKEL